MQCKLLVVKSAGSLFGHFPWFLRSVLVPWPLWQVLISFFQSYAFTFQCFEELFDFTVRCRLDGAQHFC